MVDRDVDFVFEQLQVDKVDPDILELVGILEMQAQQLGNVFLQLERARREESRENGTSHT